MPFAGLQKFSLIDYPGKVSCVAFFTGCNLHCPFCHNPELAGGKFPQRISLDEFLDFLKPRRRLLDGVVLSGGEPTLAPDLEEACHAVHRMGLRVKLDTNGSRPETLKVLIAHGAVDFVAMDLKTAPDSYAPVLTAENMGTRLMQSIQLIMQSGLGYEFRTTCVRPLVDEATIVAIAIALHGAHRYVLQRFRPEGVLNPIYFTADSGYSPATMEQLRRLAAPWVKECLLRT
jgi:pyruvate formate lyase activating enzyme